MAQVAGSCHLRRRPGWSAQLLALAQPSPSLRRHWRSQAANGSSLLQDTFRMRFPGCPAEAGSSVLRGSPGTHSTITARWPWNESRIEKHCVKGTQWNEPSGTRVTSHTHLWFST